MDDDFPEDDSQEVVTATTSSGGFDRFDVTIKDNDCKLNSLVVHQISINE